MDLTKATYAEMAEVIKAIRDEVKRRNPLLCNEYAKDVMTGYWSLQHLSECEKENFTSECGPEEV